MSHVVAKYGFTAGRLGAGVLVGVLATAQAYADNAALVTVDWDAHAQTMGTELGSGINKLIPLGVSLIVAFAIFAVLRKIGRVR